MRKILKWNLLDFKLKLVNSWGRKFQIDCVYRTSSRCMMDLAGESNIYFYNENKFRGFLMDTNLKFNLAAD